MSKPANVAETAALPPLDERMLKVTMAAAAYQARRVARTMRMSAGESEDVEQEILLTLLDRRRFFDPARGAWTPFANRIARQAAQIIVDSLVSIRKTYGGPLDQPVAGSSDEEADCTLAEATADLTAPTETDHLVKHDLDTFVRRLPRNSASWLKARSPPTATSPMPSARLASRPANSIGGFAKSATGYSPSDWSTAARFDRP